MGKSTTIAIIVLSVLLVAAIGYIAFAFYTNAKIAEQNSIYQQGALAGYQQAVVDAINAAGSSCQPVPLTYENTTVQVVNVACLQQQAQ